MKLKVLENDREYTLFCHYQSADLLFCLNDLYFDGEGCNLQPVYKHITTKNHMLLYAPYGRSIKDGSHRFLANLLLDKVDIEAYFCGTAGQLEIFNGVNNSLPTVHNSVKW